MPEQNPQNEYRDYEGIDNMHMFAGCEKYNSFLERKLVDFIGADNIILDFGAGAGALCTRIRRHGKQVDCVEIDSRLNARLNADGFAVFSSLDKLPRKYKKIYTSNVLEHIEDDMAALNQLNSALENGGEIFIYVPAFMVLYSNYDLKDGHHRRYNRSNLSQKLESAGFIIQKTTYVDSLGFLAWLLLKFSKKEGKELNPKMIEIYDRYFFPLSRFLDLFCGKLFGKNILVIAKKAA